jgi:predicted phage terminase large subunit-like protein
LSSDLRTDLLAALKEKRARLAARDSLLHFAAYTHHDWITAQHHRTIAGHLEAVERGEIKRLIIELPPRHGKSELASRRFPAWFLGRNPRREVMSVAYNVALAIDEYGRKVRNIVRDPSYTNVFPGVTLSDDSAAAGRWNTNAGGGYIAAGVEGGITGRGADLLLIDDPVKGRKDAESEIVRKTLWDWYDSDAKTRLAPGAAIVLVGTRWHELDLTGLVLKYHGDEGWVRCRMPAIAGEGTDEERALWPERFDLEYLRSLRKSYMRSHPRAWASLYQQDPQPESGDYIKREWFQERYDKKPERLNIYIVSDFAITAADEGKDPDYTEHGVFGIAPDGPPDEHTGLREPGKMYVLDWWSGQTTTDVWVQELLRLMKKWKPACWFGEGGVVGKTVEPIMKRMMREQHIFCRTERLNPITDKASRGRAFQGRAHAGLVVFPAGRDWAERVVNQCVAFPGGAHDDAFDVMAWMGLALEMAHPAIAAARAKLVKRPDYDDRESTESYKTV